ncbi:MAG: hypothetical protein R2712_07005 [Vicinamibacterales bacterium]
MGAPTLPAEPPIPLEDQASVIAAAQAWLAWFERLVNRPARGGSAWQAERLEP